MVTVAAENIPERFKSRKRWLMWDNNADTPRRPHWKGNFGISWSDSDDWHTFEEACEAMQEKDSWGIGYVFQSDDEEYMIDIDGPYTDSGDSREWFPGIERFTDAGAYAEWSPSGNGVHIPIEGEPPEWWSDCEVSPDKHQGIDVLENKFCTFTGDKLPESGDSVTDENAAPFLFHSYKNIEGESPRIDGDNGSDNTEFELSEEHIEEALDHVDETLSYSEWLRVGFAVYDWDSGSTGKRLFENWSKSNAKWDKEDGQPHIDDIWDNNSPRGDVTVGTLIHHAKEGGWSLPHPSSASPNSDTASDTDTDSIGPKNPAGDLVENDGCYGYWKDIGQGDENNWVWQQVTNFLLETLEFVKTDDTEEIRLRVHPEHQAEEPYEVTIEPTVFNEARKFKEEVVIGRTTQYETQHSDTLNELRLTVGAQEAPEREGVSHLGAATEELDEFVTPEGILTADGWADDPNYRYYAKAASDSGDESIVGEKWELSPDNTADIDIEDVRETLKLLPDARLPDRAIASMGWFYSAPAKPLIHDEEGEFNHLHIRGKTESGKTSYLQILSEAFGMNGSPWSASSTNFSLEQLHVGSRGVPVWIDEYKPSDMGSRTTDKLHRFLRIATREGVWTKGRPDQSFMKFNLQSPVVLSGEQQVGEPAVRRRMLQVNLSERATQAHEHVRAYSELAGEPYEGADGKTQTPTGVDLQDHALAYYKFLLSCDSSILRDVWTAAREETAAMLDDMDMTLQDSEFQGAQTVVFGFRLYNKFADSLGVSKEELPGKSELMSAIEHLGDNVGANGHRREHGDEFLELVSQAANAGYIKCPDESMGDDEATAGYRVYDPDATADEALAVHLPTVYPGVKRYARDYNVEEDYNLLNKSDYDDEFSDLAESPDTHVVKTSHAVKIEGSLKRCVLLEPHKTSDRLGSSFDLSAFGIYEEDELSNHGESNDDGNDGEQPDHPDQVNIGEIETSKQDIASVSASVEFGEYDGRSTDEGTPAWTATLSDGTGEAELVVWDEEDIPKMYDSTGVFEPDALDVRGVEVSEYQGDLQLIVGDTTTIYEAPEAGQGQLDSTDNKAAADGGEFAGLKPNIIQHIQNRCDSGDVLTKAGVAGKMEIDPDKAESVLQTIKNEEKLLKERNEGWEVL